MSGVVSQPAKVMDFSDQEKLKNTIFTVQEFYVFSSSFIQKHAEERMDADLVTGIHHVKFLDQRGR